MALAVRCGADQQAQGDSQLADPDDGPGDACSSASRSSSTPTSSSIITCLARISCSGSGTGHDRRRWPARRANSDAVTRRQNCKPDTQIFFSLYFTMTGLHALHMIIGVGLMMVITWMAWKGKFSSEWYTPVEMSGLYWHFVDIVWIYLFPLLYLIDRRS